ncbi:MAG: hypothetical protein Q7T08_05110 [Devosia sp.]|nr:hypothetical protein [Devosia sp.]
MSEVDPGGGFSVDDEGGVFEEYPELAILYSRVIASWSTVQGFIGLAAESLLYGRSDVAAAMFSALAEDSQQYAALYAAAEVALSKDDAELFKKALRAIRARGAGRHRLAHAVIGSNAMAEGCLLVIEQRVFSRMSRIFFTPPNPGQERAEQVRASMREAAREVLVIDKVDLEAMLSDIGVASSFAADVSILAAPAHHDKPGARKRLLERLSVEKS